MTYGQHAEWCEAHPEEARQQAEALLASVTRTERKLLEQAQRDLAGKAGELDNAERRGRHGKAASLSLEVAELERKILRLRHSLGETELSEEQLDAVFGPLE